MDPKVNVSYISDPGELPRNVAIDRKRKLYESLNISEIMSQNQVDLDKIMEKEESWLNLHYFDCPDYDDFDSHQWINRQIDEEGNERLLLGKSLKKNEKTGKYQFSPCIIMDYDQQKELFSGFWLDNLDQLELEVFQVERIFICFESENPIKYVERFKYALEKRKIAHYLIKYNYIIDCMPKEDLGQISNYMQNRIEQFVLSTPNFSKTTVNDYMIQVNYEFKRTMNKLILEKYIKEENVDENLTKFIPRDIILNNFLVQNQKIQKSQQIVTNLSLPNYEVLTNFKENDQQNKDKDGPINKNQQIFQSDEKKTIQTLFQKFKFHTIYVKEETTKAILKIRELCLQVQKMRILQGFTLNKPLQLEEFTSIQDCALASTINFIKKQWVPSIIKCIQEAFKNVGKGWFNITENQKDSFEFGKIKKFLNLIKQMMQDTIFVVVYNSYQEFIDFLLPLIPEQVKINSLVSVQNSNNKKPLVQVKVIQKAGKDNQLQIVLLETPENFLKTLKTLITKPLKEIQKIPDIKPILMSHFYKQESEKFIQVPVTSEKYDKNAKYQWLQDKIKILDQAFEKSVQPIKYYIIQHEKYKKVLQLNPEDIRSEFERKEIDIEYVYKEIKRVEQRAYEIPFEMPKVIQVGIFLVDQKNLLSQIQGIYMSIGEQLREFVVQKVNYLCFNILDQINGFYGKFRFKPKGIEDILQISTNMEGIPKQIESIQYDISIYQEHVKIADMLQIQLPQDYLFNYWKIFGLEKNINEAMAETKGQLKQDIQTFKMQYEEEISEFKDKMYQIRETIKNFKTFDELELHESHADVGININNRIQEYINQGIKLNQRQKLFNIQVTDFSELGEMSDDFQIYLDFWRSTDNWLKYEQQFKNCSLKQISAIETKKIQENNHNIIRKCRNFFKKNGIDYLLEQSEKVDQQLVNFRVYIPLISSLKKEGLRDRHWLQIYEIFKFPEYNALTHKKLLMSKIIIPENLQYAEKIHEIAEKAYKEYNIEESLNEIDKRWEETDFQLLKHRNTIIIQGYDEILDLMDEDIVKTQRLNFSVYKKPFINNILTWNRNLKIMMNILEEWQKFQQKWIYLQPIFESPDIAEQLPSETKRYGTIDSFWRHLMLTVKQNNNVQSLCLQDGILERLQDGNRSLDQIQNELHNYLEKKCEKFGRFYFLSNNDLIQILSLQREPQHIQPHLKKVFENIDYIQFDDSKITHIQSQEQEKIPLILQVDTKDKMVEQWMQEIEISMQLTIQSTLEDCVTEGITKFNNQFIIKWLKNHPGMHIIAASKIIHTQAIEKAFLENIPSQQFKIYKQNLGKILKVLVENIRQEQNKIFKTTINSLIVTIVYNQEVVDKFIEQDLISHGKETENNSQFEWLMQLRFYCQFEGPEQEGYNYLIKRKLMKCTVKCVQSQEDYGYEYLGNTQRLVITPLTVKSCITMMQAIKYNFGGMSTGPAGTGKTETVKDLSKALAKQCVVFNCSEAMDYIMIAKFFKGLVSSGAWCCFDEFNRLQIAVLSVISQQLLFLFRAKALRQEPQINFEGSDIYVKYSFGVFVTMNPGYQGKVELPDNCKSLFRLCAMMVPDYMKITEILLYSYGFRCAKAIAQKLVYTVQLVQEQLSTQPHYDFGLRNIKAIVVVSEMFKQNQIKNKQQKANEQNSDSQSENQEDDQILNDTEEFQIILRALFYINLPKLLKEDELLFKNIVKDQFQDTQAKSTVEEIKLREDIIENINSLNLIPHQNFVEKVYQTYQTLLSMHGIMILGQTGSGKSTNIKILQKSFIKNNKRVNLYCLNPKAVTIGQLFGETTIEWRDGIFSNIVRKCSYDTSSTQHWLVMDGPIDTYWIENINSVLDETKKLCLANSQILNFTDNMKMLFEIENLENSSPSIVSRCSIIYMPVEEEKIHILWDSWIKKIFPIFKVLKIDQKLQIMTQYYLPPLANFLKKQCVKIFNITANKLVESFLVLLHSFMSKYEYHEDDEDINTSHSIDQHQSNNISLDGENAQSIEEIVPLQAIENAKRLAIIIEPIFFQSIMWAFGGVITEKSKILFEGFLKKLIIEDQTIQNINVLPLKGYLFDYIFDFNDQIFIKLEEALAINTEYSKFNQYCEVLIHTNQTYLIQQQVKEMFEQLNSCIIIGQKTTGKTKIIKHILETDLDPQEYSFQLIQMLGLSSCVQLKESLFSKLEKRRKRVFGPQLGKKHIYFIDDISIPKLNEFGASPTCELLREFLEYRGTYALKELDFIRFEQVAIIGSGKTLEKQSQRFLRKFLAFGSDELSDQQLCYIFKKLCLQYMTNLDGNIKIKLDKMINSSIQILKQVSNIMLPTPTKSFYTFSIRDIWRLFNSIQSSIQKQIKDISQFLNLWYCENLRTFQDRMVSVEERQKIQEIVQSQLEILVKEFKIDKKELFPEESGEIQMWAEFMQKDELNRIYQPVLNRDEFITKVQSFLEKYNQDFNFCLSGKKNLNLIMFMDVALFATKIARGVKSPFSNCLVLGSGGKGRSSLSRLGCYLANIKLFEIGVNQNYSQRIWFEDLKKIIVNSVLEKQNIGLLLNCKKIISQSMLEDLGQLFFSGDLLHLVNDKEKEDIQISCQNECTKRNLIPNSIKIDKIYRARISQYVHLVLAMSPSNPDFGSILRNYPFILRNSDIVYLNKWSDEALLSVARIQLTEEQKNLQIENQLPNYLKALLQMHRMVEKVTNLQYIEMKRKVHVEPISFLDTIYFFQHLVENKKQYVKQEFERMSEGLKTIEKAKNQIILTEQSIIELKPELQKQKQDLINLVQKIQQEQIDYDQLEIEVTHLLEETKIEKQNVEEETEQKIAYLKEMEQQFLGSGMIQMPKLKKEHLQEIKVLQSPHQAVKATFAGLVILFEEKIKKKGGQLHFPGLSGYNQQQRTSVKKEENYFEIAKKYLLTSIIDLIESINNFNYKNISDDTLKKLEHVCFRQKDFFNAEAVNRTSFASKYIFHWIKSQVDQKMKFDEMKPVQENLKYLHILAEEKEQMVKAKGEELEKVKKHIIFLQEKLENTKLEQEKLAVKIQETDENHTRAKLLIEALNNEGEKWQQYLDNLNSVSSFITGNALVVAFSLTNFGPLDFKYREILEEQMSQINKENGIKFNEEKSLIRFLSDEKMVKELHSQGIGKDDNSIQNALILQEVRKWPLLIDPQGQANNFIKQKGKRMIQVVSDKDQSLMKILELGISLGQWIIIKSNQDEINPILNPILDKQIEIVNGAKTIRIGEKSLQYNEDFRLYICTNLSNPSYTPEIYVKLSVINFYVSYKALEEQMMGQIITYENPTIEQKKVELKEEINQSKQKLSQIENLILKTLSEQKNIQKTLEDTLLISQLAHSKSLVKEIEQVIKESEQTAKEIDEQREVYRPLAQIAISSYKSIQDLQPINIMYKYSLEWFQKLFAKGLENPNITTKNVEERIQIFGKLEQKLIFENVCMGLYEEHKLLYTFFICIRQEEKKNSFSQQEWEYFITKNHDFNEQDEQQKYNQNNIQQEQQTQEQQNQQEYHKINSQQYQQDLNQKTTYQNQNLFEKCEFIPQTWRKRIQSQLDQLVQIQAYSNLKEICFEKNIEQFENFFKSNEPYENDEFFDILGLEGFQKLIVIKTFRKDKLPDSIKLYIKAKMGPEYIQYPSANLKYLYQISTYNTPLIFLLKEGSDPRSSFLKLVEELGMFKKYIIVSLGQGQEKLANEKIRHAQKRGYWILLENCHLCQNWLPNLESITTNFDSQLQKDYRLWITTAPNSNFPLEVLQNGIKIALQPPHGLRENLFQTLNTISDQDLEQTQQVDNYKKIIFSLCFFHSVIQDRRRYGPIGWNISYDFQIQDFLMCQMQIRDLIMKVDEEKQLIKQSSNNENLKQIEIPFQFLKKIVGYINYDGKITDSNDSKLLSIIIEKYINPEILKDGYLFSELDIYYQPAPTNLRNYLQYIRQLPSITNPTAFGLNQNADIKIGSETSDELVSYFQLLPNFDNENDKSRIDQSSLNDNSLEEIKQENNEKELKKRRNSSIQNKNSFSINFVEFQEQEVERIITYIRNKIPHQFDMDEILKKFPILYEESMNNVIIQEAQRYNNLIQQIQSDLECIYMVMIGQGLIDDKIEKTVNELLYQQIPSVWIQHSFESQLPLGSWVNDLQKRIQYFQEWQKFGRPKIYWIGSFFSPRVFLISLQMNYARKNKKKLEEVKIDTNVLKYYSEEEIIQKKQKLEQLTENGLIISGVYLEGAQWSIQRNCLTDSPPLQLFCEMPLICLEPFVGQIKKQYNYSCPFYKTLKRYGQLTSTGKSNNFIMYMNLNGQINQEQEFWQLKGLAAFISIGQ